MANFNADADADAAEYFLRVGFVVDRRAYRVLNILVTYSYAIKIFNTK